jgi:transposase
MNREGFDAMDLEGRMRIMKFYCNAKKRWEKTHASRLSLNEYLSWLQEEAEKQDGDSVIMICSRCDSKMEYAGEGLYKCLRCGYLTRYLTQL